MLREETETHLCPGNCRSHKCIDIDAPRGDGNLQFIIKKEVLMGVVYINENGAIIGVECNRVIIKYENEMIKSIPIENIDSITVLGKAQMTTQCMERMLSMGIPVAFFSKGGRYFGRLESTGHIKAGLQRKQGVLYETEFSLNFSKKIIDAKLKNQIVVLKRYAKSKNIDVSNHISTINNCIWNVSKAKSVNEINGYEGQGAKQYFSGLSQCIDDEFRFNGRNRRPPKDPFNSLLSLGYSILMNDLYSEIENKGLNPYFGFMHKDAEKHPTLASDMIEEWRAVIIDSVVMSLINGHEITKDCFYNEDDGCYIDKKGLNIFLNKLEKKMMTSVKYLYDVDYPVTFRRAISLQVESLVKAIISDDARIYNPVIIR